MAQRILSILSILVLAIFLWIWVSDSISKEKERVLDVLSEQLKLTYTEYKSNTLQEEIILMLSAQTGLDIPRDSLKVKIDYEVETKNDLKLEKGATYSRVLRIEDDSMKVEQYSFKTDLNTISVGSIDSIKVVKDTTNPLMKIFDSGFLAEDSARMEILDAYQAVLIDRGLPHDFLEDSIRHSYRLELAEEALLDDEDLIIYFNDIDGYAYKEQLPTILISLGIFSLITCSILLLMLSWRNQQQLLEHKTAFTSNMTHELKTPLSTAKLALEAVQKFDPNSEQDKIDEYLKISSGELSRLTSLVERVLQFNKADANEFTLSKKQTDINQLIEHCLKSFKVVFDQKNITVVPSYEVLNTIECDPVHMKGVIYNLIDNAIKYCPSGSIIKIKTTIENKDLKVVVEDDGPGIPRHLINNVFERYYRVPDQDRHNVKGYGLGLSYVKKQVDLHGGRVTIQNIEPHGLRVVVRLPYD